MARLLQQIDETNRRDHWYLDEGDDCHYLYEYTAGQGWRGGETNQLIHNLQKKRGDGGYHYKAPAMARCARDLSSVLSADWLALATLVPIPPSKIKTDPNYDDRMVQVCRGIRAPAPADVRELVEQIASTDTFKGGHRKSPAELKQNDRIAEERLPNLRGIVGIFDDVLTTGSHFKAVKELILERAPQVRVIGLFVARRAIPNPFDEVSIEDLLK
ncbi:hypothetical protein N2605_26880 [Bradyrhizobium yuanmingense]|uniref:hypothetical protein n=1 Tax=Bradyrhizobium yuanmingense TaxID=108015 RepID=UPI0021A91B4A|nr:hypothetical protein [Bradyrhizobium sp. CB1024]UWU83149.1 hypothetical protein N2605_26880 [Bradyrhizobium sp. CB1024]